MIRQFAANAPLLDTDKLGRMVLPISLLGEAGLEGVNPILLCGVIEHLELWDPRKFKQFCHKNRTEYEDWLVENVKAREVVNFVHPNSEKSVEANDTSEISPELSSERQEDKR
jgi:DNA-binding transcriptional regulator/RsmH inhibitor MraZ